MTNLAAQDSWDHSSKGKRRFWPALLIVSALGAAALTGAWVQAQFYSMPVISSVHERELMAQMSRDAAYMRENINLLAGKVGTLQARLIEVGSLSRRIAEAAGVAYTEPEIQASLLLESPTDSGVMDAIDSVDSREVTAESLGRQLDVLYGQLSTQEDSLSMLDLLMTRRAGIEASLPSYRPVDYPHLSSSFGWRRNPVTGRHSMHEGLDFAAPKGAPIYAASGGVVTQARYNGSYGNLVEITHGHGLLTRYAHASALKVKEGDLVEKGQLIALVGSTGRSTGPHLHYEVRMAGQPLDPTLFLPLQQVPDSLIADAGEHLDNIGSQVR